MNNIQKSAIKLIENDLKFLYSLTIGLNASSAGDGYSSAILPYMGVIKFFVQIKGVRILIGVSFFIKFYLKINTE